jgi:hypothetical protein
VFFNCDRRRHDLDVRAVMTGVRVWNKWLLGWKEYGVIRPDKTGCLAHLLFIVQYDIERSISKIIEIGAQ